MRNPAMEDKSSANSIELRYTWAWSSRVCEAHDHLIGLNSDPLVIMQNCNCIERQRRGERRGGAQAADCIA